MPVQKVLQEPVHRYKAKNWWKCQVIHADCCHLHASAFERYTIDVENIRETYAHYADEDEDSLDNNGRTSTKPFHTLGRTPAPTTPATKDAGKDKKGRGDHCHHKNKVNQLNKTNLNLAVHAQLIQDFLLVVDHLFQESLLKGCGI